MSDVQLCFTEHCQEREMLEKEKDYRERDDRSQKERDRICNSQNTVEFKDKQFVLFLLFYIFKRPPMKYQKQH